MNSKVYLLFHDKANGNSDVLAASLSYDTILDRLDVEANKRGYVHVIHGIKCSASGEQGIISIIEHELT